MPARARRTTAGRRTLVRGHFGHADRGNRDVQPGPLGGGGGAPPPAGPGGRYGAGRLHRRLELGRRAPLQAADRGHRRALEDQVSSRRSSTGRRAASSSRSWPGPTVRRSRCRGCASPAAAMPSPWRRRSAPCRATTASSPASARCCASCPTRSCRRSRRRRCASSSTSRATAATTATPRSRSATCATSSSPPG